MSIKYAIGMIVLTAASIIFVGSDKALYTVPSLKAGAGTLTSNRASIDSEHKRKAPAILSEFHDLGSGSDICAEAQELEQEQISLSPGSQTKQTTPGQQAAWSEYDKLCAEARASDQTLFDKEYELHKLRLNDFLFRSSMCESDFVSCAKPNPYERHGVYARSKADAPTSKNASPDGSEQRAFCLMQKCETQALKNLQSLKQSENDLRHSAAVATAPAQRAIGRLHANAGGLRHRLGYAAIISTNQKPDSD